MENQTKTTLRSSTTAAQRGSYCFAIDKKIMLRYFWFILLTITGDFYAQTTVYQEICHCGVTGSGYSTGQGSGTGNFDIYIEPSSTIKKAYILAYRIGYPPPATFTLNGVPYIFDTTNYFSEFNHASQYASPMRVYYKDVTQNINPAISNYTVTIPAQFGLPINWSYWTFYLYVVYENSLLSTSSCNIVVNNQYLKGFEAYSIDSLNPIDSGFPVSFSVYTDRVGQAFAYVQNAEVKVNGTIIGTISRSDSNSSLFNSAGVKGAFYYQNNTLFGLMDDTPDNLVGGNDGLADISPYLSLNTTSFSFSLMDTLYPNLDPASVNVKLAYFLTYTTPCDTFSVKLLTEDTSVCKGQTVQLGVSGGNTALSKPAYEWLPQKDLSCYTCANPIFSGDSSQVYTVRIWNTDSCSKVLPVRVKVLPPPVFAKITTQNTVCGEQSGALTATAMNNSVDSLFFNGLFTGLTPLTLSNLGAGTDTLYLKDTNACVSQDTLVTINSTNNTQALFTLNPQTGAAPLHVTTNNQSTHATDYLWYFQSDSTTTFAPNFTFDTSGTYTVTLLAYQNNISCADTFSLTITVYDSLQVIVPNIITANNDGVNDIFSIQVNAPCQGTVNIFNRWGNEVFTKDFIAQGKEKVSLWDGSTGSPATKVDDGVYFYLFRITDAKGAMHKLEGFVNVLH